MRKTNKYPNPFQAYEIKLQNGDSIKELFDTKEEAMQYALNNLTEVQYEIVYIDTDLFGIHKSNNEKAMIYNNMNNGNNEQAERKVD